MLHAILLPVLMLPPVPQPKTLQVLLVGNTKSLSIDLVRKKDFVFRKRRGSPERNTHTVRILNKSGKVLFQTSLDLSGYTRIQDAKRSKDGKPVPEQRGTRVLPVEIVRFIKVPDLRGKGVRLSVTENKSGSVLMNKRFELGTVTKNPADKKELR